MPSWRVHRTILSQALREVSGELRALGAKFEEGLYRGGVEPDEVPDGVVKARMGRRRTYFYIGHAKHHTVDETLINYYYDLALYYARRGRVLLSGVALGRAIHYAQDGSVMVYVDGHTLVQDGAAFPLPTTIDLPNRALDNTPVDIRIQTGELRGLMDAIANLQSYRADLNRLANTLITQVNAIHSTGYGLDNNTGYLFFDGTDASNITLHADISDPSRIAAASIPNVPGNGGIARALADLRNTPQGALGGVSITQFYRNLIGWVGNDAQLSKNRAESQQLTMAHLLQLRESVSGVSLDEEAANLVKYQRSYQAAAKMISAFDALLEDVLQFVAPR